MPCIAAKLLSPLFWETKINGCEVGKICQLFWQSYCEVMVKKTSYEINDMFQSMVFGAQNLDK